MNMEDATVDFDGWHTFSVMLVPCSFYQKLL